MIFWSCMDVWMDFIVWTYGWIYICIYKFKLCVKLLKKKKNPKNFRIKKKKKTLKNIKIYSYPPQNLLEIF